MTSEFDNSMQSGPQTIAVGDQVILSEQNLTGEVVTVREFNGKTTYVVHTNNGKNLVVGLRQIAKV
jgi:hypothetical protein